MWKGNKRSTEVWNGKECTGLEWEGGKVCRFRMGRRESVQV